MGKGELIDLAVATLDAKPKLDAPELSDDAKITLPIPRDRDMLRDCVMNLISVAASHVHKIDMVTGLNLAHREYLKGLPEYKDAEKMRQEHAARRESAGRTMTYTKKGPPLTA